MNRLHLSLILLLTLEGALAGRAWAYEPFIHQQLTFIAARQFNQCVQDYPEIHRLSALDTRYIVKANVAQADNSVFVRMFRWNYYNRKDQQGRSTWGLVETRFHDHFNELTDELATDDRRRRLQTLGRILSYIQKVSSPAHTVPVYTGRWWRFSMSDRFDRYPVDTDAVERAAAGLCEQVIQPAASMQSILKETADDTIAAVRGQIDGFPTTWESYWKFASQADEFGEYGRAGNNFGERTEFRCGDGERCLLLKGDPLYEDFALERHLAAVRGTMKAMVLMQSQPAAGE